MRVFGSLWDTDQAAGPIIFGILLGFLDYRASWAVTAILMATMIVLFLVRERTGRIVNSHDLSTSRLQQLIATLPSGG